MESKRDHRAIVIQEYIPELSVQVLEIKTD